MARGTAAARVEDDEGGEDQHEPSVRESLEQARDEVLGGEGGEAGDGARGAGGRGRMPDPDVGDGAGSGASEGRDGRGRFARRPAGGDPADNSGPGNRPGARGAPAAPAAPGAADPAAAAAAAAASAAAPGAQPGAAQPGAQGQAPAAPAGPDLAPQGWSNTAKAKWAALPPEIRQEVSKREQDIHRIVTAQDGERQFGRGFLEIANRYKEVIGQGGVHPVKYFEDVLKVMKHLQTAPMSERIAMLRQIAARQGIDFRALADAPGSPTGQPAGATPPGASPAQPGFTMPPELQELTRWMGSFRQQQEAMAARQQQEARAAEEAMGQQVLTEIQAFRAKPESRFFDQVKDHMTVLLQGGLAATLEDAYDQAVHARPDIRALLAQEQAAGQRAEAERRASAQRARARGGSVRGGTGSSAPKGPENRTLREELEANFADARSRM